MRAAAILAAVLAAACSAMPGMPGHVNQRVSTFDNATEITVEPGGVRGAGMTNAFALGAAWSSRAPGQVALLARIIGDFAAIETSKGLEFNIDGQVISLDSPQLLTSLDATRSTGAHRERTSERYFVMQLSDFDRLLHSTDVRARLRTSRGYLEGVLTDDPTAAAQGLRSFRKAIPR